MALVRKTNYKKIVVYSFLLLVLIGGGFYFLYISMSGGSETANTNAGVIGSKDIIRDYDQEFLETGAYHDLVEFGSEKLPLDFEAIEKGRPNPFNPF